MKLYTIIIVPKGAKDAPIVLTRTPNNANRPSSNNNPSMEALLPKADWTFPRAHWADVDKDNATGNQKILAPALADGTLVGRYGIICRAIRASQLEA